MVAVLLNWMFSCRCGNILEIAELDMALFPFGIHNCGE